MLELEGIKNKLIISGFAGSGKTYLIRNSFDNGNYSKNMEKYHSSIMQTSITLDEIIQLEIAIDIDFSYIKDLVIRYEAAKSVYMENKEYYNLLLTDDLIEKINNNKTTSIKKQNNTDTIITSISKNASKNSYENGCTIASILLNFYNKIYFRDLILDEELQNPIISLYESRKKETAELKSNIINILKNVGIRKLDDFPKHIQKIILDNTSAEIIMDYLILNTFVDIYSGSIEVSSNVNKAVVQFVKDRTKKQYKEIKTLRNELSDILWKYNDYLINKIVEDRKLYREAYDRRIKSNICLIFDEFSMIPYKTIQAVISILRMSYNIETLILVGDIAQLPPINEENVMNNKEWCTELANFKSFKLNKLYRKTETENNISEYIVQLPYMNRTGKIQVCEAVNDIMSKRKKEYSDKDFDFAISYRNTDAIEYEKNMYKSNSYIINTEEESDYIGIKEFEYDKVILSKINLDLLELETYINKLEYNTVYNIDDNILDILDKNKMYFTGINKLWKPFYNKTKENYAICFHSATVHKTQGTTIENNVKTVVDLNGSYIPQGLHYVAITRNKNFDDLILKQIIKPEHFIIQSIFTFPNMITINEYYEETIFENIEI